MAQWSAKWTTAAGGTGDQVEGYTQAHYKIIYEVLAGCLGFEGVAIGLMNELTGTVAGANTVNLNTGGALVDGHIYQNSAVESINIPSAVGVGNTRIDRIVLRCSWSENTIRIIRVTGTNAASPTAPALVQTSGTTYDIPLYQALVDLSGNVTLTDERAFVGIGTASIGDAAVTNAKIADGTIGIEKFADKTRQIYLKVFEHVTAVQSGDGKLYFTVPQALNGTEIKAVHIALYEASTDGAISVQLYNLTDTVDVLSTAATIDEGKKNSYTAAVQPVVNAVNAALATGDILRVDVDGAGVGAKGLDVIVTYEF